VRCCRGIYGFFVAVCYAVERLDVEVDEKVEGKVISK
jgi:hypothetical protein